MSIALAQWLTEQRDVLLQRWGAAVATARIPAEQVAHGSEENGAVAVETAEDARVAAFVPVFDALIGAAHGATEGLNHQLQLLVESDLDTLRLPDLLQVSFQLRRSAWQTLQETESDPAHRFALMTDLEHLLEQSVEILVQAWSNAVAAVQHQQMQEVTFLTQSMSSAMEEVDQAALNLQALNATAQELASSMEHADVDAALEVVADKIMDLLSPQHLSVWMHDADDSSEDTATRLSPLRVWGTAANHLDQVQLNLTTASTDPDEDPVLRAYLLKTPLIDGDLAFSETAQWPWHFPQHGIIVVPLVAHNLASGVVLLQDDLPTEHFTLERQNLLIGLVSQLAIALDNVRLYRQVLLFNNDLNQIVEQRSGELAAEKERLTALQEISVEVSSTLDVDVLLTASLQSLAQIVRAPYGSIMLVDRETEQLETRAVLGYPSVDTYVRFPIGSGVAGWVAQHKKPALIPDVQADERWVMSPNQQLTNKQAGSILSVPLIAHQEVVGVLTLSHNTQDYFNQDHIRLLAAAAGTIAVGVYNANLFTTIADTMNERSSVLQRLRAESTQITSIMQSLVDGVIVCDIYGAVQLVNRATERLLGRSYEELLLQDLHTILHTLLGNRRAELPLDDLLSRPQDNAGELRIFDTTFELNNAILSLKLSPVLSGDDDEMIGAILMIRDTTREVISDRLKTEFISTMSHELRTPMTAIKGFTQLMVMGNLGPLSDTQMELMTTIQNNSERMIAIINDVLELTKIESGEITLDLRPIHLAEALSGVMIDLGPRANQRKHALTLGILPGLPLVQADAAQLHKVLYNLISNAIKYTPEGGKVAVDAREVQYVELTEQVQERLQTGRSYLQITVRDTGVGIQAADVERIFDRFYRTENALKIEAGGTGLGLSLTRPLIELMSGAIWVESEVGVGTTFSFVLPTATQR
ncbi:MAG: GAF domain-containing protein [Chloroflexaceae bacterium]|nr:GAF domain-containing protein [Chloroflexaceae bacterium]